VSLQPASTPQQRAGQVLGRLGELFEIGRRAGTNGLDPVDLPSGAGHHAAVMAATAGIPSAMLFIRSDAGGVSHASEESTGADAIAACAQALEPALRELAA